MQNSDGNATIAWLHPGLDSADAIIFWKLRLPRFLAALVIGAGLAVAGTTFQCVLRNPLAEPYTLGISSGSALFAVLAIRLHLDTGALGSHAVGLFALLGALVTVWLVWHLGKVAGQLPPATLLLAGVTVAMFSAAASMAIQYTSDFSEVYRMIRWMMGGLESASPTGVAQTAALTGIGIAMLWWISPALNALSAGADAAASVGVNVKAYMTTAFVVSSLLVGSTIALGGPIGFVGLFVPHALRPIVGPNHKVLIPLSALYGGALLALCDVLAREAIAPDQLPVGIVTALFGGPFFVYLLIKQKASGRFWQ